MTYLEIKKRIEKMRNCAADAYATTKDVDDGSYDKLNFLEEVLRLLNRIEKYK